MERIGLRGASAPLLPRRTSSDGPASPLAGVGQGLPPPAASSAPADSSGSPFSGAAAFRSSSEASSDRGSVGSGMAGQKPAAGDANDGGSAAASSVGGSSPARKSAFAEVPENADMRQGSFAMAAARLDGKSEESGGD